MVEEDLLGATISGEEVDADEMERMQRMRNEVEEKVSVMLAEFNAQKALKPLLASTTATTTAAPAAAAAAAAATQGGEVGEAEAAQKKPPMGVTNPPMGVTNPPMGVSTWNDYESRGEEGKLNLN